MVFLEGRGCEDMSLGAFTVVIQCCYCFVRARNALYVYE
jgi:hypothetical protein